MQNVLIAVICLFCAFSVVGQDSYERALASLEKDDLAATYKFAKECYESDSMNTDCIGLVAKSALGLGDMANAKKFYHLLEKLDTTNMESLVQLASIYETQQQIPRAIKYYSLLNKKLPENPIYFRKNARLFNLVKDYREAFRLYAVANKLNPRDVLTLKGLAEICIRNNQMDMADSLIHKSLEIDAENVSMSYLLARSKYRQKQFDSVTFILEGLRGRVDLDSYNNKLLGYAYLQIDSIDLAVQKLQLALVDEQESEKLHFYLATAYEKKEEMEGAMDHYNKAIKYAKSPDLDLYHRNAARLAYAEKNFKEAIANYKDAYKYGQDPVVLYQLATISDIYYKDKSIAINYFKKYIKSGHSNKEYLEYARQRSRYLVEMQHQSN